MNSNVLMNGTPKRSHTLGIVGLPRLPGRLSCVTTQPAWHREADDPRSAKTSLRVTALNLLLGDWLVTLSPVVRTFVLATIAVPIVI